VLEITDDVEVCDELVVLVELTELEIPEDEVDTLELDELFVLELTVVHAERGTSFLKS
jgi:hypothetical protein